MNKTFLFIIILVIFFAGVAWFLGKKGQEISSLQPIPTSIQPPVSPIPTPTSSPVGSPARTPTPTPTQIVATPKIAVVNMVDSGFQPIEITIKMGDMVRFVNQGSRAVRPASGIHPTHNLYPEKGGCINSSFDACRGLQQGESFSFTFNFKGTWPFHDHFQPSLTGRIIVQ